jgi:tetratricopeptide (TPR) repeat protein
MLLTEIDQLLIEKKLDNNLTETEKIAFNQRLADPVFASEMKLYEQAIQAIYAFGDDNMKAILQEEEAKLLKKTTPLHVVRTPEENAIPPQYGHIKPRPTWQRWAMAASFLLLASVALWFVTQENKGEEKPQLASIDKKYDDAFVNLEKPTTRSNEVKDNLDKAYALYDNEDFAESLPYFEQIKTPIPYDLLLQANAYLKTNQTEKALPILEKLSQAAPSEQQESAEWYYALALLKMGDKKADAVFEKIKNTAEHLYQGKATELLKK